jgi:hypothetical protein
VVTCTGATAAATLKLNAIVAVAGVPAASFTCAVNEKFPACVGVPLIAPDAEFNVRPLGSDPAEMLQV